MEKDTKVVLVVVIVVVIGIKLGKGDFRGKGYGTSHVVI